MIRSLKQLVTVERTAAPKQTWKLIIGVLLFLAVFTVCLLYIHQTTVPLSRYEISPAADPARWTFTLENGTVIQPENGSFPFTGTDTVVICETVITGTVLDKPLLVIIATSSDCVFFLDGKMIYSPSGRYTGGAYDSSKYEKSSASGQFVLPELGDGKRLTMIVQFSGEENRLTRMPKLTLYPEALNYLSQFTGAAVGDALPAGVYFTVALFLAGLFLIGLWKRRSDPGLILLAVCALSMAFQRTVSFYGVAYLLRTPTITWFGTTLIQLSMSWMLWYRLSKKLRRIAWLVPGAVTAAALALFFVGLDNLDWVNQMHIMTAWGIPAAVLLMIIASVVDAVKGNLMLRRLFRFLAWSIPVVALGWGFSLLTDGNLAKSLKTAFSSLTGPSPTLYYLCGLLCELLLMLFFVQGVLDLIGSMARQDAEMQAMALRESYAMANLEIMRQTQEETRRQRHEVQHHLMLLEGMLSQKQDDRAAEYIRSLLAEAATLPSDSYSENMVINAIAGYYLNAAKSEGVRVEADIRVKVDLPLKDEELCVLLTNLLENALEACRTMKQEQERFISLSAFSDGKHLHISCKNSTLVQASIAPDGTIPSSKPNAESHGYGLHAIRRIVDKYYGTMNLTCVDGCFTVKLTL